MCFNCESHEQTAEHAEKINPFPVGTPDHELWGKGFRAAILTISLPDPSPVAPRTTVRWGHLTTSPKKVFPKRPPKPPFDPSKILAKLKPTPSPKPIQFPPMEKSKEYRKVPVSAETKAKISESLRGGKTKPRQKYPGKNAYRVQMTAGVKYNRKNDPIGLPVVFHGLNTGPR